MSALDIVELPGHPGLYARRVIVEAWQEAGSPPVNDAGRLYRQQKSAWDAYQNGTGSPADNPDLPLIFPLGHVRFVALDITPTPERVRRLSAAGLVRPFSWESWHWAVPNVWAYPLVTRIPTTTETQSKADEMTQQDVNNINAHTNSRTALALRDRDRGSIFFVDDLGADHVLDFKTDDIGDGEFLETVSNVFGVREVSARDFDISVAIAQRRWAAKIAAIAKATGRVDYSLVKLVGRDEVFLSVNRQELRWLRNDATLADVRYTLRGVGAPRADLPVEEVGNLDAYGTIIGDVPEGYARA